MTRRAYLGLAGIVTVVMIGWLSGAWAAGEGPLAEKHKAAGIECAGCHKESPPKAQVETPSCAACHGDYVALAAKTEKKHPNPHASHQGEMPCESCHHSHARSVDYCSQCHDFGFKVP
jgi:fumarate reductase flavoprotein subunit